MADRGASSWGECPLVVVPFDRRSEMVSSNRAGAVIFGRERVPDTSVPSIDKDGVSRDLTLLNGTLRFGLRDSLMSREAIDGMRQDLSSM